MYSEDPKLIKYPNKQIDAYDVRFLEDDSGFNANMDFGLLSTTANLYE